MMLNAVKFIIWGQNTSHANRWHSRAYAQFMHTLDAGTIFYIQWIHNVQRKPRLVNDMHHKRQQKKKWNSQRRINGQRIALERHNCLGCWFRVEFFENSFKLIGAHRHCIVYRLFSSKWSFAFLTICNSMFIMHDDHLSTPDTWKYKLVHLLLFRSFPLIDPLIRSRMHISISTAARSAYHTCNQSNLSWHIEIYEMFHVWPSAVRCTYRLIPNCPTYQTCLVVFFLAYSHTHTHECVCKAPFISHKLRNEWWQRMVHLKFNTHTHIKSIEKHEKNEDTSSKERIKTEKSSLCDGRMENKRHPIKLSTS